MRMDPASLILTFIVLENVGDFASACSLLPEGIPKCFPDAVDYDASYNNLKEIKYRLDKRHIFGYDTNSLPFSRNRKDVRLGQYWEKKIGRKTDTVMCTKDTREDAYLPQYDTHVYNYHRVNDKIIGKSIVTSLFVVTKKEVWNCKDDQELKSGIHFKRVVTELVSRLALGSIFFFDGIEVTTAPIPYELRNKDHRWNTTIAREVKYIDHKDNNKVVRFDGNLQFKRITYAKDEDSSVFKPVRFDPYTYDENNFHREELDALRQTKYYYELQNEQGIHWEDIHRPYGQIGQRDSELTVRKATCKILDEDDRLYRDEYLPHWAHRRVSSNGFRKLEMDSRQFKSHFVVTKHEIWSCTMEQEEGKFERHVLEYIGLDPVKTIDYYIGNKVWQYNMDHSQPSEKSVGVRAVFYFTANEPFQRRMYDGMLKLEEVVEKEETKKKKSIWRLIRNLFSRRGDMPEEQYLLGYDENDDDRIIFRPK